MENTRRAPALEAVAGAKEAVVSTGPVRGLGPDNLSLVLAETAALMDQSGLPYVFIGGIPSSGFGRQRWTKDIDVLVKPEDAEATLDALASAGFTTERTDPRWLFKAFKHDVLVDVVFVSAGGVQLDQEMLTRAVRRDYHGLSLRFVAPEDLLLMKAMAHSEERPRHWHDALGVLQVRDLDWEYLLRRARRSPRRVLSLLMYAQSLDLAVPNRVVRDLFEQLYGR